MRASNSYLEAVVRRWSEKKVFLEIWQNSQENIGATVSYLIKLQTWGFIKKDTVAQVFSCEICEISKNTFIFIEQLRWLLLNIFKITLKSFLTFLIVFSKYSCKMMKQIIMSLMINYNTVKFLNYNKKPID